MRTLAVLLGAIGGRPRLRCREVLVPTGLGAEMPSIKPGPIPIAVATPAADIPAGRGDQPSRARICTDGGLRPQRPALSPVAVVFRRRPLNVRSPEFQSSASSAPVATYCGRGGARRQSHRCDLVALNKCGNLEAAGGGLRDAFAHTDSGKALSFSAAAPVSGRRCRLPGMQTRDLRFLKTLKTATVASTPAGNLVNVG